MLTTSAWFQETLHFHGRIDEGGEDSCNAGVPSTYRVDMEGNLKHYEEKLPDSQQSLIKNWPLMSSIIIYCIFQLHDMAYTEVVQFCSV